MLIILIKSVCIIKPFYNNEGTSQNQGYRTAKVFLLPTTLQLSRRWICIHGGPRNARNRIEISVKGIDGTLQKIPQLKSNESQKLLGVMKNPMGDQQDEIIRLKKKSDTIAKMINSNKLSRTDAKIAYEAFYIPAVRYSLNITSINQVDLETVQSKAILALFLAAQGYNRHMPREIVFASNLYQGLGFRHMYYLQEGSDSTQLLLLQELNQEGTMTQKMILALLDTIQVESGIGQPILENCKALVYIEWG